jgi:hypothetical protein
VLQLTLTSVDTVWLTAVAHLDVRHTIATLSVEFCLDAMSRADDEVVNPSAVPALGRLVDGVLLAPVTTPSPFTGQETLWALTVTELGFMVVSLWIATPTVAAASDVHLRHSGSVALPFVSATELTETGWGRLLPSRIADFQVLLVQRSLILELVRMSLSVCACAYVHGCVVYVCVCVCMCVYV